MQAFLQYCFEHYWLPPLASIAAWNRPLFTVDLFGLIGAVITPTPDPINQTIVSVPIYLLFELGMLLGRFFR